MECKKQAEKQKKETNVDLLTVSEQTHINY